MKWEKLIQSGFRMPFYMNLYVRGSLEDVEKVMGFKYKDNLIVLENQINNVYFNPILQLQIEKKLKSKVNDEKFRNKFIATFEKVDKDLIRFCSELRFINYSNLNRNDLIVKLNKFSKLFKAKFGIYGLPVIVDLALVEIMPNILEQTVSKDDLMSLTKPILQSEYVSQRRDFIEIILQIKNAKLEELFLQSRAEIGDKLGRYNPKIYYSIEKHVRDFSWYGVSHHIQPMTIDTLIENIKDGLKDVSLEQELESLNDNDFQNEKNKIISYYNFNKKELKIFEFITKLNEIKEERKIGMCKSVLWSYPLFEAIADILKIDTISLRQLTLEEITGALKLGKLNDEIKELANQRLNLYVCMARNGMVYNFSGIEAKKIIKNELEIEDHSKIKELRGSSAQKGLIKGNVRLIMLEHEIENLLDNEVLVTSMTDPNMISAMKKAAAIVTDEGGITCHAAIVARELKTPCIIGTKIATKVLKDGDFVEVDANSGVVKIIKKANEDK